MCPNEQKSLRELCTFGLGDTNYKTLFPSETQRLLSFEKGRPLRTEAKDGATSRTDLPTACYNFFLPII